MSATVLFERRDHAAVLTLNRPEAMNAMNVEMRVELNRRWAEFRDDPELWVAVVTGAGEKAFCAGADLKELGGFYKSTTPAERRARWEVEPGIGGITHNLDIWKPIIAAVNGHCLAGGIELALACDIRIASENATFGLTEVQWGIIPGAGGTQRLPRLIPFGRALEMLITAEKIDAAEAGRIGLVNRIVPQDELMPTALAMAERICRNGPLAVRLVKEAACRGMDRPLAEGLRLEQLLAEYARQSEDAQEGPKAFAEKRQPAFKGR
ncbi:MAG: enoyl-CoA hydratase/isomerase family protein [Nitrospirae bacterium]|nr:enoyl-CoA hydratase/isomerase family protein [Nitrospirota bacterium]